MRTSIRLGFTLIELIVVIGIIMVLMALALPAIMKLRAAADMTESRNNLKQIGLALHNYDMEYKKLPRQIIDDTVHRALLPYLEQDPLYRNLRSSDHYLKVFVSPADPTLNPSLHGYSSYAANAQIFVRRRRLANGFPDGLSNTIGFTEHYAFQIQHTNFSWFDEIPDITYYPGGYVVSRAATFAENGPQVIPFYPDPALLKDVYPVFDPIRQQSRASIPGKTFQIRPSIADADPRIPQTPHNALLVLMMDASVRGLSGSMSETTFWSAVTPNGGEILGNDWIDSY